jgi:hypothetical protein
VGVRHDRWRRQLHSPGTHRRPFLPRRAGAARRRRPRLTRTPAALARAQLPKIMELVGLGYSSWFVYRYLLFKARARPPHAPARARRGPLAAMPRLRRPAVA